LCVVFENETGYSNNAPKRKRRPLEMAQIYQLSLISTRTAAYSGM
jgi:hypothetical protein